MCINRCLLNYIFKNNIFFQIIEVTHNPVPQSFSFDSLSLHVQWVYSLQSDWRSLLLLLLLSRRGKCAPSSHTAGIPARATGAEAPSQSSRALGQTRVRSTRQYPPQPSMCQKHLEDLLTHRLRGPTPGIIHFLRQGAVQKSALLTSPQAVLMLLVLEPHLENHYTSVYTLNSFLV